MNVIGQRGIQTQGQDFFIRSKRQLNMRALRRPNFDYNFNSSGAPINSAHNDSRQKNNEYDPLLMQSIISDGSRVGVGGNQSISGGFTYHAPPSKIESRKEIVAGERQAIEDADGDNNMGTFGKSQLIFSSELQEESIHISNKKSRQADGIVDLTNVKREVITQQQRNAQDTMNTTSACGET
jgi:hypothetical protein